MDEANGKLMGAHGYCTQEMVNLLLGGRAVSNVFNDTVTLDGAPGEKSTVLQGVSKRSDVGLLSLFEHYRSCQVIVYTQTWICSSFSTPIFFQFPFSAHQFTVISKSSLFIAGGYVLEDSAIPDLGCV